MNRLKTGAKYSVGLLIVALTVILFLDTTHIHAKSKDIKKPKITLKSSHTNPVSSNIKIKVTITDESGIKTAKWAAGNQKASYFSKSGKKITLDKKGIHNVTISDNGVYTFYAQDKAGNETVKKITINNIDKTLPTITYSLNTKKPTNKNVKITVTALDKESGVKEAVYLSGKKKAKDFQTSAPKKISLNTKGKGSFSVKDNGNYTVLVTDQAGNQTLQVVSVKNIDKKAPSISLSSKVFNQVATVTVDAIDDKNEIASLTYIKGNIKSVDDERWESKGKEVKNQSFTAKSDGVYSVLAIDAAGNKALETIDIQLELKGVWISYLEFATYGKNGFTDTTFKNTIDTMFDNIVDLNMNAVIVQVRPFGDAMYPSAYFPWSRYISGQQGKEPNLSFDPLAYMVEAAHDRGLSFHAWLNPYRVTTASTDYMSLAKDNPARIWYEDDDDSNDRNVLEFSGNLYYNPASEEVQELIVNGIEEIIQNYEVDGIHFDDYFYPTLGGKYATIFDNVEYIEYVSETKEIGEKPLAIADWRRENVNTLIRTIYATIKEYDETIEFGISPAGAYTNLSSNLGYYVDYDTWLSSDEYIDYICPQIYWTFSNSVYPYDKTLDAWVNFRTSSTVKIYIGIANYRAGSTIEKEWKDVDVLKNQIEYARDTGSIDGFMFFRYDFFYNKTTKPATDRMLEIL